MLVGSVSREEHVQHSSGCQDMLGEMSAHKEMKTPGTDAGAQEQEQP